MLPGRELARAKADLATAKDASGSARQDAASAAVSAARGRLRQLLDPARETVSAARADVAGASADLAVLRQRGAPATETDLAIAGLRVDLARQQLQLAREMCDRRDGPAPASGTVTSVLSAGARRSTRRRRCCGCRTSTTWWSSVNLTEFDVSKTRVGAAARISADALGGRPFGGEVLDVALSGGDSGGVVTFPVIISVEEAEGPAARDERERARRGRAAASDVVRIPLDAIEDREGPGRPRSAC